MAFAVRHRRRARAELEQCARLFGTGGPQFKKDVETWLAALADEAERNDYQLSANADEFLKRWSAIPEVRIPKTGMERWLVAGCREKISAFVAWLQGWIQSRHLLPPSMWEFRMAMEVFLVTDSEATGPSGQSLVVVLALYEVNRLNNQIVVTIYPELPGSPVVNSG